VSGHYDETALQDYLDDPDAFPDRAALEQHVETCQSCGASLEELRAFNLSLTTETAWELPELAGDAEPPEAIRMLAEMLVAEDAEAEELVRPLLGSPAAFRRANITAMPAMRTAGVVRFLAGRYVAFQLIRAGPPPPPGMVAEMEGLVNSLRLQ